MSVTFLAHWQNLICRPPSAQSISDRYRDARKPSISISDENRLTHLARPVLKWDAQRNNPDSDGAQNGAKKPPLAPSTWIGISRPVSFCNLSSASCTALTGWYSHVKVTPKVGTTPIVFSSTRFNTSSAFMINRPFSIGISRSSTSK